MVAAALKIIEKRGLTSLTMREAAKTARVSHETPRAYFPNGVPSLLAAVAEEGHAKFKKELNDVWAQYTDDEDERLVQLGVCYVRFGIKYPSYFAVMFSSPQMRDPTPDAFLSTFGIMVEGIRTLRPSVGPQVHANLILLAWSLVHGLATLWTSGLLKEMGFVVSDASIDEVVRVTTGAMSTSPLLPRSSPRTGE